MANEDQRAAWDGPSGTFWTAQAERFDRGVAAYDAHLMQAAAVAPGESVLDVGCGTGAVTRALAPRAGRVVGVDLSTEMIERARALAPGMPNASFLVADAQAHPFEPASFDVVVSRHGTMFFDDPAAAFSNLAGALRPDGRLALLVWRELERNPFIVRVLHALTPDRTTPLPPIDGRPSPFSMADPARVRAVLAEFDEVILEPVEQPVVLGADPDDALDFQTGQHASLLADLDAVARARAVDRLRADLTDHYAPGLGVRYPSAAWLITARGRIR